MARIYIVSSSLFVKGRLFAAARLEEFIRANVTGDEKAFKILAPMVGKGTGTKRPIYDTGFGDGVKTKKAVQQAREWSAANEPEEGTSAVSSLQEGSATDQPLEDGRCRLPTDEVPNAE